MEKLILFVGIQGSGKGTQAKIIAEKTGLVHISTGDLFRSLTGELKQKVDEVINGGNLVSNELTLEILKQRIEKPDCKKGIILDGFPRNLDQAKDLDKEFNVAQVIEIAISDEEALKRLSGRVSCPTCKRGYNLYTEPKPKNNDFCDDCNEKLVQRADDNEEAIKKRIQTYHKETKPILEHYQNKLIKINGEQDIDSITKEILEVLE